jgi:hypothetical protein
MLEAVFFGAAGQAMAAHYDGKVQLLGHNQPTFELLLGIFHHGQLHAQNTPPITMYESITSTSTLFINVFHICLFCTYQ